MKNSKSQEHTTPLMRLALVIISLVIAFAAAQAYAQTFQVIHNFTGPDGGSPLGMLAMDRSGNLYGTAYNHGAYGFGTAWKLSAKNSGWIFAPLHNFNLLAEGGYPGGGLTIGPDGSLYGTTTNDVTGCGIVFNLRPSASRPVSILAPWDETVLRTLQSSQEGCQPNATVTFDSYGNLYATTDLYGRYNAGSVFELSRSGSGWTENTLYSFRGNSDGGDPLAPLIFDGAGNIYGTTAYGGPNGTGTVFEMTPSGSGWSYQVLTSFPQPTDGYEPHAGVIFDNAGNLYGATYWGQAAAPTVFELSANSWNFNLLYTFGSYAGGPLESLTLGPDGSLYGATSGVANYGWGSVFKLTPSAGGWTYTSLHDFTGGSDGGGPSSNIMFDAAGNLYGTASAGGTGTACTYGCGVVWKITP